MTGNESEMFGFNLKRQDGQKYIELNKTLQTKYNPKKDGNYILPLDIEDTHPLLLIVNDLAILQPNVIRNEIETNYKTLIYYVFGTEKSLLLRAKNFYEQLIKRFQEIVTYDSIEHIDKIRNIIDQIQSLIEGKQKLAKEDVNKIDELSEQFRIIPNYKDEDKLNKINDIQILLDAVNKRLIEIEK